MAAHIIGGLIVLGIAAAVWALASDVGRPNKAIPRASNGHWLFGQLPRVKHLAQDMQVIAKQGPVVRMRLGIRDVVVVSDAALVKQVLAMSSQRQPHPRPSLIQLEDVFSVEPEETWRPLRRRLNPFFTTTIVSAMFPKVNDSAMATVRRIHEELAATADQVLSMEPVITRAVMDSLVRCVFSREFDEAIDTERIQLIMSINNTQPANIIEGIPIMKWLYNPWKEEYLRSALRFSELSSQELEARKREFESDPTNAPKDFVSNVLGYYVKDTKEGKAELSPTTQIHNTDAFFFAGLDTTANSLLFVLVALCENPRAMKRAVQEVDMVFSEFESDGMCEATFVPKLVYLDKVLKESARLRTVAPITSRVVHEDMELGDFTVQANSLVALNIAGVHRSPQHWERPNEFYPEHFDEDAVAKRDPRAYLPFGGGARVCIAFRLALLEQRVILAHLLHSFTFELVPGQNLEMESGGLTSHLSRSPLMKLVPRT